jgi:hypothetical protein
MVAKAAKKSSKRRPIRRAQVAPSREERAAYGEVKQGVRHLERSIQEIQRGLRKAERQIEADARARIRELRREARTELGALKSKRREAARLLDNLSAAAGESWREVKASADGILADARTTAASVVNRIRAAISR